MRPKFVVVVALSVFSILAVVSCSSSTTNPVMGLSLNGTWVTTDAATDQLSISLTQAGETVVGTGTLIRVQPADTVALTVFGANLDDLLCETVCTPISLTIADAVHDTLFVSGAAGDSTHFSGSTLSSTVPGRFASFTKTILIFAKQ